MQKVHKDPQHPIGKTWGKTWGNTRQSATESPTSRERFSLTPWVAGLGGRGDGIFSQVGSTDRLMGTDQLGRDVSSRVIPGARMSLIVAAVSLGNEEPSVLPGASVRLVRGLVDEVAMGLVDSKLSFPHNLIALILGITLGQSLAIIVAVLHYIIPTPTLFNREYRLIGLVRSIAQSWPGPTKVG